MDNIYDITPPTPSTPIEIDTNEYIISIPQPILIFDLDEPSEETYELYKFISIKLFIVSFIALLFCIIGLLFIILKVENGDIFLVLGFGLFLTMFIYIVFCSVCFNSLQNAQSRTNIVR